MTRVLLHIGYARRLCALRDHLRHKPDGNLARRIPSASYRQPLLIHAADEPLTDQL